MKHRGNDMRARISRLCLRVAGALAMTVLVLSALWLILKLKLLG